MALSPPQRQAALAFLNQLLARRGVDTQAADAVFGQEGASGGIGDNGHAFGPGQFNDVRGVWTGRYQGLSPEQKNEAAWSRPGLRELAERVASVSSGLHGPAAVQAIVSRFERPADPHGEISRALAAYGGGTGTEPAGTAYAQHGAVAMAPDARRQAVLALISSVGDRSGGSVAPLLDAIRAARATAAPAAAPSFAPASGGGGGIAELLREGTGGPTHSTGPHIHAAFTDPQQELAAIQRAQQLGLSIRENPYVGDTVDPVHAPNSYHTRTFPGLFNGRRLGEAIDVSGPEANAFYAWLAQRKGR